MPQTLISEKFALTLHVPATINLTPNQFYEFCQVNRDLQIERTAEGDLIIMTPAGGETSRRNVKLIVPLEIWAEQDGTGLVFKSSGGFTLPNGATRSPDAAWVKRSRLAALNPGREKRFLPLCPDFVIELRSPSDSLNRLKEKMVEYITNGAQLGWLIDPENKTVYIYRPDSQVTCLENPASLSGEAVLSGFALDLQTIWPAGF